MMRGNEIEVKAMFFSLETPKTQNVDEQTIYDFLSLGGGPAGLNGALYAKRKGLKTAVVTYDLGGQLKNTSSIDNYLGFESIDALELIDRFVNHLKSLDVPLVTGLRITGFEKKENLFLVTLEDGRVLKTKTALIAFGGSPRKLSVPGEDDFSGKGVSYCATCDGPFFRNKHVVVAGGGNSAVEAAIDLSKVAANVTIIHRSQFRADQTTLDQLYKLPKVHVLLETQILELRGDKTLTGLWILDKKTGKETLFPTDGLFVEIGSVANTQLFAPWVKLNERGEIIVDEHQQTSLEGLYAAGDVTEQVHRQVIISAAEGAKAALYANLWMNKKGI